MRVGSPGAPYVDHHCSQLSAMCNQAYKVSQWKWTSSVHTCMASSISSSASRKLPPRMCMTAALFSSLGFTGTADGPCPFAMPALAG